MSQIRNKQISGELNELEVLSSVTSAYAQLSSLWMGRARGSILKSRDYLEQMNKVFKTIFSSYAREVRELAKQNKQVNNGKITFLAHNGKTVAVFLSANTGFFGEIVNKTFELFLNDVRQNDLEATIVGKQGRALFLSLEPDRPHTFFELSDERAEQSQLNALVQHLVQYKEVRVYYGKFENLLNQEPVVFTISADPYDELEEEGHVKRYIFEPNIEKLLMFFENQIFGSVFEQTVRESQLAKFASRLMVMDRAGQNIKLRAKVIEHQWLKLAHQISNQKQVNQYTSMALWRNKGLQHGR